MSLRSVHSYIVPVANQQESLRADPSVFGRRCLTRIFIVGLRWKKRVVSKRLSKKTRSSRNAPTSTTSSRNAKQTWWKRLGSVLRINRGSLQHATLKRSPPAKKKVRRITVRSGVLLMQKLTSLLSRTQSCQRFSLQNLT